MKGKKWILLFGFLLISVNLFAADGDVVVNGNLTVSGNLTAPNVLTKYYQSSEQTIGSGGSLTLAHGLLAHGLGVEPIFIQVVLKCITAEAGYSVGDKLFINPNLSKNTIGNQGVVIVPDATNLNIRFGNAASVFTGLTKNTGASIGFTDGKWRIIFRALSF